MAKAKQHRRKKPTRRNSRFEPSVLEREDLGVRRVKTFRIPRMSHTEYKARKVGKKSTRESSKAFKARFGAYSGSAAPREPWTPRVKMPRLNPTSTLLWYGYGDKTSGWRIDRDPDGVLRVSYTGTGPGYDRHRRIVRKHAAIPVEDLPSGVRAAYEKVRSGKRHYGGRWVSQ